MHYGNLRRDKLRKKGNKKRRSEENGNCEKINWEHRKFGNGQF